MRIFLLLVLGLTQLADTNAASIQGVVIQPNGAPAVGAVVALTGQIPKITATGATGHFEIHVLSEKKQPIKPDFDFAAELQYQESSVTETMYR